MYDKEYYEKNKKRLRNNIDKWRDANKEEVNRKQREKRANLTQEERDEINRKAREKRAEQGDLAREKYRMYYEKNKEKINAERRRKRKELKQNG